MIAGLLIIGGCVLLGYVLHMEITANTEDERKRRQDEHDADEAVEWTKNFLNEQATK